MHGGDLRVSDPLCQDISRASSKIISAADGQQTLGIPAAISTLLSFGCGAGPFLLSYTFNCGALKVLLIGAVCYFLNACSFFAYLRSWIFGTDNSYLTISENLIGHGSSVTTQFFLIVCYIGTAVSEVGHLTEGLSDLFSTVFSSVPTALQSEWVVSFAIPFVFIMPILFFPTLGKAFPYAIIYAVSLLISIVCMIILFAQNVASKGFNPNGEFKLWGGTFGEALYCFAVFGASFFIQPFVPRVASGMKDPSRRSIIKAFLGTEIANVALMYIGGFCGYGIFYSSLSSGSCLKYFTSKSFLVITLKVCNVVLTICVSAIYNFVASVEVCHIFFEGSEDRAVSRIFAGLIVFFLYCAANLVGGFFSTAGGALSSILIFFMGYVYPTIIYIKSHGLGRIRMSIAAIFVSVFTMIALICLVFQQLGYIA